MKDARIKKKISKKKLGEITKIKEQFIDAIENENWNALPEKPVVSGFIGSISNALKVNPNRTSALFRRDYPQKPLKINPNPEISDRFVWNPKATFLLSAILVIFVLVGYVLYQYINFVKSPMLSVEKPMLKQEVTKSPLEVTGKTDPNASVFINNQPVEVKEDGMFVTFLDIGKETKEVEIKARSRSGKETVVKREIVVDFD